MYKVYDKPEAIRQVQIFLSKVDDSDIFIAPTGVFDDNTARAVLNFQNAQDIEPTGVVDKDTFDALYLEYMLETERDNARQTMIAFPLRRGVINDDMTQINRTLKELLDYYGFTHRLRDSNYYSSETDNAVKILSGIYLLDYQGYIDEIFYLRMIRDRDSIRRINFR